MADLDLKEQMAKLLKAVQEQTAKIDRLGGDVAAVDKKVGALNERRPANRHEDQGQLGRNLVVATPPCTGCVSAAPRGAPPTPARRPAVVFELDKRTPTKCSMFGSGADAFDAKAATASLPLRTKCTAVPGPSEDPPFVMLTPFAVPKLNAPAHTRYSTKRSDIQLHTFTPRETRSIQHKGQALRPAPWPSFINDTGDFQLRSPWLSFQPISNANCSSCTIISIQQSKSDDLRDATLSTTEYLQYELLQQWTSSLQTDVRDEALWEEKMLDFRVALMELRPWLPWGCFSIEANFSVPHVATRVLCVTSAVLSPQCSVFAYCDTNTVLFAIPRFGVGAVAFYWQLGQFLIDKHSWTDCNGRDTLVKILLLPSKPPDDLAELFLMFYFLQLTVITREWMIAWSFSNIGLQCGNLFCAPEVVMQFGCLQIPLPITRMLHYCHWLSPFSFLLIGNRSGVQCLKFFQLVRVEQIIALLQRRLTRVTELVVWVIASTCNHNEMSPDAFDLMKQLSKATSHHTRNKDQQWYATILNCCLGTSTLAIRSRRGLLVSCVAEATMHEKSISLELQFVASGYFLQYGPEAAALLLLNTGCSADIILGVTFRIIQDMASTSPNLQVIQSSGPLENNIVTILVSLLLAWDPGGCGITLAGMQDISLSTQRIDKEGRTVSRKTGVHALHLCMPCDCIPSLSVGCTLQDGPDFIAPGRILPAWHFQQSEEIMNHTKIVSVGISRQPSITEKGIILMSRLFPCSVASLESLFGFIMSCGIASYNSKYLVHEAILESPLLIKNIGLVPGDELLISTSVNLQSVWPRECLRLLQPKPPWLSLAPTILPRIEIEDEQGEVHAAVELTLRTIHKRMLQAMEEFREFVPTTTGENNGSFNSVASVIPRFIYSINTCPWRIFLRDILLKKKAEMQWEIRCQARLKCGTSIWSPEDDGDCMILTVYYTMSSSSSGWASSRSVKYPTHELNGRMTTVRDVQLVATFNVLLVGRNWNIKGGYGVLLKLAWGQDVSQEGENLSFLVSVGCYAEYIHRNKHLRSLLSASCKLAYCNIQQNYSIPFQVWVAHLLGSKSTSGCHLEQLSDPGGNTSSIWISQSLEEIASCQGRLIGDKNSVSAMEFSSVCEQVLFQGGSITTLAYVDHHDYINTKGRQVPWDPGGKGADRLEGKPDFKEGGMSRTFPSCMLTWAGLWVTTWAKPRIQHQVKLPLQIHRRQQQVPYPDGSGTWRLALFFPIPFLFFFFSSSWLSSSS